MADYLALAMRDAGRIELRHQDAGRWRYGLFDDLLLLREAVDRLAGSGNLYATLNAPRIMPAPNTLTGAALRDDDIAHVVRLPIDFDPVRPRGVGSTDAELAAAVEARDHLVAALSALDWPAPAMAISGNGAHALYRCRLRVGEVTAAALRTVYHGLRDDFSTGEAVFDSTVCNASRVWRLYGTTNRKGEATAERPHRLASIDIPARWDAVSPRQVTELAAMYRDRDFRRMRRPLPPPRAAAAPGRGDYSTLDVVVWFAAHGAYKRQIGANKHAVICPWSSEHSTADDPRGTDTVIWEADPPLWPQFHCSHAHCDGRTVRDVLALWADVDDHCGSKWERP